MLTLTSLVRRGPRGLGGGGGKLTARTVAATAIRQKHLRQATDTSLARLIVIAGEAAKPAAASSASRLRLHTQLSSGNNNRFRSTALVAPLLQTLLRCRTSHRHHHHHHHLHHSRSENLTLRAGSSLSSSSTSLSSPNFLSPLPRVFQSLSYYHTAAEVVGAVAAASSFASSSSSRLLNSVLGDVKSCRRYHYHHPYNWSSRRDPFVGESSTVFSNSSYFPLWCGGSSRANSATAERCRLQFVSSSSSSLSRGLLNGGPGGCCRYHQDHRRHHRHHPVQQHGLRGMATSRSSPYLDAEVIQFLENFQTLVVKEALQSGTDRNTKVLEFQKPEDLEKLLNLEIGEGPESRERMLEHCSQIIKYSIKSGHPRFFNQLYSGLEPYSLVGSWLTESLNTNLHTYEVAPVFVVMEKYLMNKLCQTVGFPQGEGIFCPGGSFSNIMAVHLARYRNNPEVSSKGLWDMPKVRLYTSDSGHYSMKKSSMFLGIGTDNVIPIPTDSQGKMMPDALDAQMTKDRAEGYTPLIVMATSGTTVLGSYDPLNSIADVCKKHGVWMHTDCAWGGGVLLSEKYKHLMAGVERSDSVAWNLHKMCHVTIQASALMVKEVGLLQKANGLNAEYLFQPEKPYDINYDIGDRSVQCGRKVDCLKVWMTWKGLGDKGMCDYVERAFENANHLTEKLREREGFRLVLPKFECTNISFWYIPPCLRGKEETAEWWQQVGKVAPIIKRDMMMEGNMMIGYQPLTPKNLVNFFRVIVINSLSDFSDMDFIVDEIDRLGKGITMDQLV